jgi:tripartite-type tricarboxylate transporter receptor subunit TctC
MSARIVKAIITGLGLQMRPSALGMAALIVTALLPGAAQAQELFSGKTVEVIVAGSAGGGYDQYARTIAKHMGKHLPGKPNLFVRDMPGAGGLVAASYLFNVAPKDGSVIALLARETAVAPLLAPGATTYQFKSLDFNWIGSPQQDLGLVLVNAKAPAQTLEELKTKPMVMSGVGPGSLPGASRSSTAIPDRPKP